MSDGDDDHLLAAYRETRWTVDAPGGPAEIRVGTQVAAPNVPTPAAIVTAYNPRSVARSRGENERSRRELEREVNAAHLPHLPVVAHGTGPDAAAWNEPGLLLVGLHLDRAVALAARYGQNAILWIGDDRVPALIAARPGFAGAAPGTPI